MSARSLAAPDLSARRAPGIGGFNVTILRLEIRRLLRNRRTVLFAMVLPVVFFLLFGLNSTYANQKAGHGNVSAVIMISMALYVRYWPPQAAARWCRSSVPRAGAASCG